jgi:NAD(P)H-dependent flavin oxidoreductase YrpB (nitropropane dioxygenase family)
VGQIVGSMNRVRPARDVIFDMVEEYIETTERMAKQISDDASAT